MIKKPFNCDNCGASGRIELFDTPVEETYTIICCPICGSDLSDDTYDDDAFDIDDI